MSVARRIAQAAQRLRGTQFPSTLSVVTGPMHILSTTGIVQSWPPNATHCAHCAEPLPDQAPSGGYCSKACELASQVAARLGAPQITTAEDGPRYSSGSTASSVVPQWLSTRAYLNITGGTYISTGA